MLNFSPMILLEFSLKIGHSFVLEYQYRTLQSKLV